MPIESSPVDNDAFKLVVLFVVNKKGTIKLRLVNLALSTHYFLIHTLLCQKDIFVVSRITLVSIILLIICSLFFFTVGAGSSGPVVANRLSEDPKVKVLLLEAGGYEVYQSEIPMLAARLQMSEYDWQYKTEPQKYACQGMNEHRSNWPRGKILGGCSTLNYMLYVRGNKKDYDIWESYGNYGWGWNGGEFTVFHQLTTTTFSFSIINCVLWERRK